MSMLKKVIGVLIVLLLLQVSVVIMQSHAADDDIFNGVDISKNEDGSVIATLSEDQTTLTISGTGEMKGWQGNYSKRAWHSYKNKITKVIINNGVTNIGDFAFYSCLSLKNVEIPSSVTIIGQDAFGDCRELTSISIPEGVTSIEYDAFKYCESLSNIEIPGSVTSIIDGVFFGCWSLDSINVDSKNIKYTSEDGVLFNKEKSEVICYPAKKEGNSYSIPQGVTSIAQYAFGYCRNLNSIVIPEGVTSIERAVFEYCSNLRSISIPEGVTKIGYYSFGGCKNLTNVEIPDSVTLIESHAFNSCINLTDIEIPRGVIRIWDWAFDGCSELRNINVNENNEKYMSENGVLFNKDKTSIIRCPEGKKETNYKISSGVTNIKNDSFKNCSSLKSIEIPSSVSKIGQAAFFGCKGLTSISIPEGVIMIDGQAFASCSCLSSISFPSSVININVNLFDGCKNLNQINVSIDNANYTSENGMLLNKDKTKIIKYPIGKKNESYDIPKSVVTIGAYAFSNFTNLHDLELNSNITTIEDNAFIGCKNIEIYMPETVTSIGRNIISNDNSVLITYESYKHPSNIINNMMESSEYSNVFFSSKEVEYEVENEEQLKAVFEKISNGDNLKNQTIKLKKDINLNGNESNQWTPVGCEGEFKGIFDGDNHIINGIYINNTSNDKNGFFGENKGLIKDIEIRDSYIVTGSGYTAGIVAHNIGVIKNAILRDSYIETNGGYTAAIAAHNGSKIIDCKNYANIISKGGYIGGIEGYSYGGRNTGSINYGNIQKDSTQKTAWMGGISGCIYTAELSKCQNYGNVTNNNGETGGIAGYAQSSTIEKSCNLGSITSNGAIGGIVGIFARGAYVSYVYNRGSVTKVDDKGSIGGIVGYTKVDSKFSQKYKFCYNAGKINYNKENTEIEAGQIIGKCEIGELQNCYYLNDGSSITGLGGESHLDEEGKVGGKSVSELKSKEIIKNLNIEEEIFTSDKKNINLGYPIFTWQTDSETQDMFNVNTYTIEDNTIKNIQPNMIYEDFIKNIETNMEYTIKERDMVITGTSKIKTGQKLKVGEVEYALIVTGDCNGDGQADIKDILQINKHRLNKAQLTSVYFIAGDVNKDGKVDIKDILQLNKYRLGKISNL